MGTAAAAQTPSDAAALSWGMCTPVRSRRGRAARPAAPSSTVAVVRRSSMAVVLPREVVRGCRAAVAIGVSVAPDRDPATSLRQRRSGPRRSGPRRRRATRCTGSLPRARDPDPLAGVSPVVPASRDHGAWPHRRPLSLRSPRTMGRHPRRCLVLAGGPGRRLGPSSQVLALPVRTALRAGGRRHGSCRGRGTAALVWRQTAPLVAQAGASRHIVVNAAAGYPIGFLAWPAWIALFSCFAVGGRRVRAAATVPSRRWPSPGTCPSTARDPLHAVARASSSASSSPWSSAN